jgi:hypothetical protein
MSDCRGLSGGVSSFPRRAGQVPGRGVGTAGSVACLTHSDFAPNPSMRQFDCLAWAVVIGLRLLEEVQYVLRAIGRPQRKKVMLGILQGAAATHGNKPGIPVLGENHWLTHIFQTIPR